jgi:phytoene dehydrogenase-like protein
VLSPFLKTLPLAEHGLRWCEAEASVAHPLADGRAALLVRSLDDTGATLGDDARAWRRLVEPFLVHPDDLMADVLAPLGMPRRPLTLARFGWRGLRSARALAHGRLRTDIGRALFAGLAGHAILPLEHALTGAVGLIFAVTGHLVNWPCAGGGSAAITDALASLLRAHGGTAETGVRVRALADLPPARAMVFAIDPRQVAAIAGDALPAAYRARLERYRYGPGAFKVDWALSAPIPWRAPECARASTVHVGGTFDEIAASERDMWEGRVCDRPFVLVCQQSLMDPSRAPPGKHTGYAYCHVPAGCDVDMTDRIEAQIERFAPGFRDCILARHVTAPADFARENPCYVGGAITGGVADVRQLFTRPVARWNPHTTPNPRLFLGSASTPPGGGVHGMGGFHAAQAVLRRVFDSSQ